MSTVGHDQMTMNSIADGMADSDQLSQLSAAQGPDFDRLFVSLMTAHHEGAIAMAKSELNDGTRAPARELAQGIIGAQTAEIAEMRALAL